MLNKLLKIALAISTITGSAQNHLDALRYSDQNINGTARYSAMAGAFGSLGAEFAALSSNPAGIGMYQFSEITFTPSLNFNSTKSYYKGMNLSSYKVLFSTMEHSDGRKLYKSSFTLQCCFFIATIKLLSKKLCHKT